MVQQVEKEELVRLMNIITIFERIIGGRHWLYILYYIISKPRTLSCLNLIFKMILCLFFPTCRVKIYEISLT